MTSSPGRFGDTAACRPTRSAAEHRQEHSRITLSTARGKLILLISALAVLMVGLDSTALNIALPALERHLHASVSGLQWVVDTYNLVVASLMLLASSTGDRVGRRRTFRAGLLLFGLGSVLCGLASGLPSLIGFRGVQALGGAMLAPVSLSVITHTFTDRAERSRAIGAWSCAFGLGLALGPLVGGVLVAVGGWRSVFWINVPVVLALLVLTGRFLPESRTPNARPADLPGQALVIALLGALTFAIIEAPHRGWGTPLICCCLALAAAALAGLIRWERRRPEPLIELRFFRSAPFSGSVIVSLAAFAALGGFLFITTLYLQNVRGLGALPAGLWMLPMPVMTVVFAPVAGQLVARRGPRLPMVLAGLAIALSGLMFAACHVESSVVLLLVGYGLFGAGVGLVDVPATGLAVDGMPRARAGVASAITMVSCRVGVCLGVAVIGAVLSAGLHGSPQAASTAGFLAASRAAWWVVTGCGGVVCVLGALVTGRRARRTARTAATRLACPPGSAPQTD
ncbi:MFS transporter [Kitasatospora kifunensis]|uniref:EmrB/QacA subfamily drug resistance transporter n=1 Tax=Kitasatospora kifunensis TaxID=58351 RepID=A0A7W7R9F2_KITKI|nr:MFS transporter [Kitasatospora kifunensis]MBB4927665.1 EmrB/QacA subfamily drug resistance transporter [Kitasatospora kifunensis]